MKHAWIFPFLFLIPCLQTADSFSAAPVAVRRRTSVTIHQRTKLALFPINKLSLPIIPATDTWGNIGCLCGSATLAQRLGKTTRIGRLLGPPVSAMAITFFLASMGVLNPGGTPAAKTLQILVLQLATPLVLLGADLRDFVQRCGPLLISFCMAACATLVGCLVGWKMAGPGLTAALGNRDALVLAAALLAKNIGGGINYIAVCRSLSASPQAIAAGLCIDNLFALIYFPVTSALASGKPDVEDATAEKDNDENEVEPATTAPITVEAASTCLFLAAVLVWLGERVGGPVGALPWTTVFAVVVACRFPIPIMNSLRPSADVLGTTCLYLFFSTAGAPGVAVAPTMRASVWPLTLFLTCLYSLHGTILWMCHCLFSSSKTTASATPRLLVASSAAIGGPATAAALCQSHNWKSLIVPALIVGNVGYAVATFVALGYFSLLQG